MSDKTGTHTRLSLEDKSNLEWDYSITGDKKILAETYNVSLSTVNRITQFYRETGKFFYVDKPADVVRQKIDNNLPNDVFENPHYHNSNN